MIAKSWARISENLSLGKDLSRTIKDLFYAILSRITDKNAMEQTKLKV